ncbi:hypothetical protein ACLOJK_021777 [Asimina triloba]
MVAEAAVIATVPDAISSCPRLCSSVVGVGPSNPARPPDLPQLATPASSPTSQNLNPAAVLVRQRQVRSSVRPSSVDGNPSSSSVRISSVPSQISPSVRDAPAYRRQHRDCRHDPFVRPCQFTRAEPSIGSSRPWSCNRRSRYARLHLQRPTSGPPAPAIAQSVH